MSSSDPPQRRQSTRRRRGGAPAERPVMDWGAWLEGDDPRPGAGQGAPVPSFPISPRSGVSPRSGQDPVLDLRTAAADGGPALTRRARRQQESGKQDGTHTRSGTPGPGVPDHEPVGTRTGRARWALPVLAALLALVAATCLVDTRISALVALATFCPAVAVAAIPVIALGFRGRRWVTVAVAGLAAVLPWALAVGYAVPGPGDVPAPTQTLQVMTVNAQFGQASPGQILDAVRDHAVDVLVITELTSQLAHDLTVAGLPALMRPQWIDVKTTTAGGIGLWSRFDKQSVTTLSGTRWPAATVALATPAGPISVVAAHVSPPIPGISAARWRRDLSLLTDAAASAGGNRLVVGDLNASPWHAPFRRLASHGMRDAADVLGHGLRNTWPAWAPAPLTALDHVVLGGDLDVRAVDTLVIDGTDHRALLVSLVAPTRPGD